MQVTNLWSLALGIKESKEQKWAPNRLETSQRRTPGLALLKQSSETGGDCAGACREAGATLRDVGEEGPSRWENIKNVTAAADSGDPKRQSLDVLFDHHNPLRPRAPIRKGAKLTRVPQPASFTL